MARIFISHSSRDNDAADRMMAWLASQGFENALLDKDKTTGIPPGGDWERTLYREVEQSQAVVIIQTPNWLASKWCFAEFTQARALGKAIFPAIEAPTGDTLISPDIQTLNLMSDRDGGLERLKRELVRIALDAQGGFAWDSTRPPFPGLLAFQEEDAAVYFGRDDDIRRLIERLDARRAQGGAKLIALLGSSGSGKSSLLRAGVIPRLKRAGRNWIVVPAMRPRIHPVDELARALATASNPPLDWAKLRDDLSGADPARALDAFAGDLRVKAGAGEAQILLPIDQVEELFGVAEPDEARRFLEILSRALSENLPFMAVMTMRSDFLGQLQSATALTARFEEFSLGPMPLARVPQIIEGPARIAGLGVEDAFVQQAAGDAETEDALPLLAFALRELLDRSPNKSLTLVGYTALGDEKAGLTPLENAVRRAADEVLADAKPGDDELTALRDSFVPAMVRVNYEGEYVRRPARLDELPAKAQPLLERLAKARLLVLRQDGDARVVEVAHEALLRKWPLLKSWLDSALAFLIGKQQLEQDLRDWDQAAESDKAGALLTGLKLGRARRWLIEHPNQLSAQERAFIQASIERAEAETRRTERTRRIITWGSLAAALVLLVISVWAYRAQGIATENAVRAEKSEEQANEARDIATANEENARKSEQRAVAAQKTAESARAESERGLLRAQTAELRAKIERLDLLKANTAKGEKPGEVEGLEREQTELAKQLDETARLHREMLAKAMGFRGDLDWLMKREGNVGGVKLGSSEVLIDPGTSLSLTDAATIKKRYEFLLTPDEMSAVLALAGKRGDEVKAIYEQHRAILERIQLKPADVAQLVPEAVESFWNQLLEQYPVLKEASTPGSVHTALLSLAFNVGMRKAIWNQLSPAIAAKDWSRIADLIEISTDKVGAEGIRKGIRQRRIDEANLIRSELKAGNDGSRESSSQK